MGMLSGGTTASSAQWDSTIKEKQYTSLEGGGGGGGREVFSSKIPLLESFQLPEKLTGSNKSCLPLKKNGGWVVVGGNTWWCTIYLKRFGIWHILELFEAQKPTTDFVSSFYLGLYLQTGLSLIIHYLLGYLQAYL